jgi:hypothetical protein
MNKLVDLYPNAQQSTRSQVVRVSDLEVLKKDIVEELLKGIKILITGQPQETKKKWLKSREVRSLLDISPGTLQTLRDKGTIPHCKVGGIFYYDPEEIDKEIQRRKSKGRNHPEYFEN